MAKLVGKQIDKICNIEYHPGGGHLRGFTDRLYNLASKAQGEEPLTYLAAKALMDRVAPGDTVIIATGTGIDQWVPEGESDGPVGAAALARALTAALDAKVVVTCEEAMARAMDATLMAAGEFVYDEELFFKLTEKVCTVEPFPLGFAAGQAKTAQMLEKYKPKAMVFIERMGPNEAGIFHCVTGTPVPDENMSYGNLLADEGRRQGILTIGIGDGGNEVGFGLVHDELKEVLHYGKDCKCPCGKGVATVTGTDVLISAAVSNWGAYGIAAMLAYLKRDLAIMHDEETEYRMIEACALNGCVDGLYMKPILSVDGIGVKAQQAVVTLMREAVRNGLMTFERAF